MIWALSHGPSFQPSSLIVCVLEQSLSNEMLKVRVTLEVDMNVSEQT